ncbi:MAG TPA: PQQ-dependent sugar dehydrogenase [Sphingopyxis sp.]|uniref:PQQ-dependent sugar dehydrogenase n=1 Tax=Sphingopyxis sp. TaxID=1908224 RepID=UPI002D0C1CD5|nr:PQQ-dependent sugar dehydrogenase [Sphingopyxis sp.]HWW55445.1 PQQ-dependent sugar dehydrogenase [Sphingopyxis sp.]
MRIRVFAALAPLILTSCGGGGSGGGGGGNPPANNAPPAFTSPQTASVAENITGTAYQATATDPNNDTLTFSIDGGADAARFSITGAGALRFNEAPDYDLPGDADGDNVYTVQLRVSDGQAGVTQTVNITVTNSREGISVVRVATGFDQPLYVAPIPGSSNVYVVEKEGNVYRFDPANGSRTLVLDINDISTDGERGLLGIAAYPDHASSQRLFAVATATNGAVQVRRYTLGQPNSSTSYDTVLNIPHPPGDNHNGGWIGYGPDGHVYVAVGDGNALENAQNVNSRLGKILRFAVGAGGNSYSPAPGNPFIAGGGDPYVYAYGLRNPFRASFSGSTLIIGDVGQNEVEEVDMLSTTQPGLNFGWPFREGTRTFSGTAPAGLINPVAEYFRGNGPRQGATVTGGYVYRGPVTSLQGQYVFTDFISGNIWTVPFSSLVAGQTLSSSRFARRNEDFTPDAGTISQVASFGEDSNGNLFLVSLNGSIFMVRQGS